jgi:hypothetical protein
MQLTTLAIFFSVLLSTLALLGATPVPLNTRDVFVPPVLYPHNGTVWIIKQRHHVTWYSFLLTVLAVVLTRIRDTSNAPVNITNKLGLIMLRKGDLTTPCLSALNHDVYS